MDSVDTAGTLNYVAAEEGGTNGKSDGHKSVGIGMDSAIIPLKKYPGLSLIQSVDFFYPLVDDPYTIGMFYLLHNHFIIIKY